MFLQVAGTMVSPCNYFAHFFYLLWLVERVTYCSHYNTVSGLSTRKNPEKTADFGQ